ncbi:MAG: hypothetical protein H6R10_3352 [Rhodocyclaceae bacterium]|nr:hypothetical protein [Rhodocyclaceae bacterium]
MSKTIKGRIDFVAGGVSTVRLLITHPMAIERTDPKTGQAVEAHFIESLAIAVNGEPELVWDWGQAVSTNPFVSFGLHGLRAGDGVTVTWRDNRKQSDSLQLTVN